MLVDGGGNYLSDLVSYPYLASAGVLAPKLWDGSTNNRWSNANNWTPAGVPVSGDDVVIPDGATTPRDPRLEMDAVGANSIRSLTVAVGGILNLTGGGSSLQIDENAIIYGTVDRSATVVNISGSAVIIGGTFSHDGSGDITAPNATMTINPGASYIMLGNNGNVTVKNLVVNGLFAQETRNNTLNALNITINPGGEYRNTRNTLTSLVNISGTFTNNGTMSNSTGGNFRFSGAAGVIDGSSISTRFYRLTLLGGTLSVSGSASPAFTTLDEGILLSAGTLNAAGRLIDNSGDWTNDGASLTGSGSLIRFTGGNAASLDNGSAQTIFQNLAVDKNPGVNLTAARALNIDGDFTIGSGNFIPGVYTHTVAGNWNDAGGGFAPSAGAIVLDGISPAVTTAAANNFFNLTIYTGGTASMGTSELDVNGALVIFSGAGLNCGSNTLNDIAGTTSAAGTLDMGTGTTNLRGPAVVTGTGRMILQTAGGAAPTVRIGTGAAMGSLTVGGIFQSAGSPLPILTDNGNQRYAFNIQNTATVNINGLNINRPNTGGLSIADGATITAIDNCTFTNGTAAGTTYLGLGQTSGTYTFSFCGFDANCLYNVSAPAGTESVTMNNASGAKGAAPAGEANDNDAGETHIAWTYSKQWDGSASTAWNNAANWTPAGVPVSTDAVVIPPGMPRQPLLNMNATGASRISSLTLASGATLNLNSASVYTLQIDGNSVFNGTVNLTTAAVNIGGAAVTIGGAFNHTGTGDLTTSGTMTVKPGAIYTMSGAGGNVSALNLIVGGLFLQQTGDNTLSIADLTINSGGEFRNTRVSAGSIVSISGILTNNGSMSGTTGGVFTFTGAASGIAGDVAPVFGTFALTGGATVISATPVPAVLILLDVVLNGGTLSAANKTIAVGRNWTNNGGSFTGSNSAVLLNTATAGVIDNGSAQTAFQNVTIAKSAGVGLSAGRSLNIDGNFTLSSGLFVPGAFTHTLAGNWNDNGGGFAPASGAIVLDGTSPSITTALINNFFNLTISSSGTAGMGSSELDVNGTLSVSTGATLNCGSNPGNDIAGITSLNGTLDMGTGITSLRGAVTVNSGGILRLSAGGSVLRLGSGATSGAITVSSGGTLTASGSPRPAITRQGTANYALTVVSGATLSIDGLNIDFPDANGLNIAGGAVVTMIDNCFFSNGIPAATTYLKFGNSTGSRTFNYCDFDANCLFNVSAPTGSAANLIYMFEATGAKGASPNGEANDNDPDGDNHINWTYGKQWVGITSTNWQVGSNWSPPSAPTSSDDVLISDQANDPVLPGAGGTARKITITNGVLTLGTNTLQVTGDFIIQSTGTLNAGTGTVVLNGPAGQIINANGKSFYNLAIGNSQDNTLQSDITVNGALQVNAGSGLTVAAGRTLTLTAGLNLNGTLELKENTTLYTGGVITSASGSTFKVSGISQLPGGYSSIRNNGSGNYGMTLAGNVRISCGRIFDLDNAGLTLSGGGGTSRTFANTLFYSGQSSSICYLHVTHSGWNGYNFSGLGFQDMGSGTKSIEINSAPTDQVDMSDYYTGVGWVSGDASELEASGTVNWISSSVTPLWSRNSIGAIRGGAIGDVLFVGTDMNTRELLSINPLTGATRWSYNTTAYGPCNMPTYIYSSNSKYKVVVAAGNYVIGRQDEGNSSSQLFAPVNLGSAAGNPYASPDDANFYVVSANNVTKRSMSDGSLQTGWPQALANVSRNADPVIFNDELLVSTTGGVVCKYDLDGTPGPTFNAGAGVTLPLIVIKDNLYISPNSPNLYAVNVSSMSAKWSGPVALAAANTGPAWCKGTETCEEIYVAAGSSIQKVTDNGATGSITWTFGAGANVESGPIENNDVIYFGRSDGRYYAIRDVGSGASLIANWPYTSSGGNSNSGPWIDVVNSLVIFGTTGQNLDAFALE